jgi:prophage regulatory protein
VSKRIVRFPEACTKTGYSRPHIYRKIKDGTFPLPVKLGDKAVGFVEDEIDAWIEQRIALRDGGE